MLKAKNYKCKNLKQSISQIVSGYIYKEQYIMIKLGLLRDARLI